MALKNTNKQIQKKSYFEKAGFYGGRVVISGIAIGLPGKENKVFSEDNFDRILSGKNCIEPVEIEVKQKIVDLRLQKLQALPTGDSKLIVIDNIDEVIQLAGQLGYFNAKEEYGIGLAQELGYQLAMAAGIEALKDAKIPLLPFLEKNSKTKSVSYHLPFEYQESTGVIFTSAFSTIDTMVRECEGIMGQRFYKLAFQELERVYEFLTSKLEGDDKNIVIDWFTKIKKLVGEGDYKFDKNLIFKILQMANGYFAQMIRAKGPNTQSNAACAASTQAIGIAEDWIRTGRCDRVVIISSEIAGAPNSLPIIGASFLALGAATIKKNVKEAAKPFDRERNGMIIGSGAVGIVLEREDSIKKRGFKGQAEVLGILLKNSAFHGSRSDINFVSKEMKNFVEKIEKMHSLKRDEYTSKLLFMSHETYTPARGGGADAEISALRESFPKHYKKIMITNTKGFTGHTLGAGIEDAVLVSALQKGKAPPIANLNVIEENFKDILFSKGEEGDYQFGIHHAAGFGSQFAILFIRRIEENSIEKNKIWEQWLASIVENKKIKMEIERGALVVKFLSE